MIGGRTGEWAPICVAAEFTLSAEYFPFVGQLSADEWGRRLSVQSLGRVGPFSGLIRPDWTAVAAGTGRRERPAAISWKVSKSVYIESAFSAPIGENPRARLTGCP